MTTDDKRELTGTLRDLGRILRRIAKVAPGLTLAALLASCVTKPDPPAPVMAPTVRKPSPVKPVDLGPVRDALKPVKEGSRQMMAELDREKAMNYELRRNLAAARAAVEVSGDEWDALELNAGKLQASRDELYRIVGGQVSAIESLEVELLDKAADVAMANVAIVEREEIIEDANQRIIELTQSAQRLAQSSADHKAKLQSMTDDRNEQRGKLLFWRAGTGILGAATLFLAYLAIKPRVL